MSGGRKCTGAYDLEISTAQRGLLGLPAFLPGVWGSFPVQFSISLIKDWFSSQYILKTIETALFLSRNSIAAKFLGSWISAFGAAGFQLLDFAAFQHFRHSQMMHFCNCTCSCTPRIAAQGAARMFRTFVILYLNVESNKLLHTTCSSLLPGGLSFASKIGLQNQSL